MKNEVVQREDSFPKTPPEDFHVVSKFKTNMGVITKLSWIKWWYCIHNSNWREGKDKSAKKEEITCFRCKKLDIIWTSLRRSCPAHEKGTNQDINFPKYPPLFIVEMLYNCVFWLDSFPHHYRVHATISPRKAWQDRGSNRTNIERWNLVHMYKSTRNIIAQWTKNIKSNNKQARQTLFSESTQREKSWKLMNWITHAKWDNWCTAFKL